MAAATPTDREVVFEAKRMEIIRDVARVFAKNGYHETSVNSLAEILGVSKPTLYYYAQNKEDLLFQCYQVGGAELLEAMDRASTLQISGMGQVRRFFAGYTEIMCGDFGRCIALTDNRALSPEARSKDVETRRSMEDAVQKMIIAGQADGSVGPCNAILTTRALFGAFNGIPRWFAGGGGLTPGDVADSYLDLFFTGMGRVQADAGKGV